MDGGQTDSLLIMGLDGLSWPLLEPLLEAGAMPHLARLRREGAWGPLASVVPTHSATAWASFLTGQNPARHGVTDFTVRQADGSYRHARPPRHDAFWYHLAQGGQRVGIVNFPVTYPPDPVPEGSFLVSGMLTPKGRTFTSPAWLGDELLAAVPGYRLDLEWQLYAGREGALLAELADMTRRRAEAAAYLQERFRPDCLAVAFIGPDRLQHALWRHLDPGHPAHDPSRAAELRPGLHGFYTTLDESVGRLVAGHGGRVLVLSDHGFQAAAWQFRMDDWLAERGWLARAAGRSRLERWARRLDRPWLRHLRKRLVKDISRHLTTFAPGGTLDWSQTVAFCPWNAQQGVRLNVRGREPQGIVAPGAEYERLRDEIAAALQEATEPHTGRLVVGQVWRREEVYEGPYLAAMPDLVLTLAPGFASSPLQPGLWDNTGWGSGDHSLEGILVAHGPGIISGPLQGAALVDVAPTALYLLGQPVPSTMDGQVLAGALEPALLAARPIRRRQQGPGELAVREAQNGAELAALTPEEEAEVQEHLRGLGYL